MAIVTPWTVRRLPVDDIDEILYRMDLRGKLGEMEKEKIKRIAKRKEMERKRQSRSLRRTKRRKRARRAKKPF